MPAHKKPRIETDAGPLMQGEINKVLADGKPVKIKGDGYVLAITWQPTHVILPAKPLDAAQRKELAIYMDGARAADKGVESMISALNNWFNPVKADGLEGQIMIARTADEDKKAN